MHDWSGILQFEGRESKLEFEHEITPLADGFAIETVGATKMSANAIRKARCIGRPSARSF